MVRVIWKGAISFGLVHIPVGLNSASRSGGTDFDWLDARSLEPVGYKRVNKVTGKEVPRERIVKGVEYEKGRYVVLSEEEIRAARPRATQTIDILRFVERGEIPLPYFDTPYYLSPERRGEKVYVLLRETLARSGKVAVCQLVLHSRQHLAALLADGEALLLMTLRWPGEVRPVDELALELNDIALDKREREMATRLVEDMSQAWDDSAFKDTFSDEIHALVEQKAAKGQLEEVPGAEAPEASEGADIIDLTDLLRRSLRGNAKGAGARPAGKGKASEKPAEEAPARRKAGSRRRAAR
ncbi:Ku protein [Pseudomonas sp. 273]|uniref:non-homologous end joining protein Ku n=1 Tax=Pseudomonas sp. 273 TaxID=75692 RepID=UPI0023D80F64|nr:Ku protein [Pseudomonas sp. 273]